MREEPASGGKHTNVPILSLHQPVKKPALLLTLMSVRRALVRSSRLNLKVDRFSPALTKLGFFFKTLVPSLSKQRFQDAFRQFHQFSLAEAVGLVDQSRYQLLDTRVRSYRERSGRVVCHSLPRER